VLHLILDKSGAFYFNALGVASSRQAVYAGESRIFDLENH
jgi:hypothetical protein